MTDPFKQDSDSLLNFATGVVLPADLAENLVNSTDKGREQMNTFIEERLNSNEVGLWNPIPNLKVKTFNTTNKKIHVKASNEKIITVNADRDLFGRLLIAANVRQINLKEVLCYELSPIPFALAHQDGSLRKTNKSTLATILEENTSTLPRLPVSTQNTVFIVDGMAMVQVVKSGDASTFGDMALKYYTIIESQLTQNNCNKVHLVFDQYWDTSIKYGERVRRGTTSALEVHINGPSTPVPKQWGKYIANPQNKVNLCDFLTESLCKIGQERIMESKKLFIGGGYQDGEPTVCISNAHCDDIAALKSNHEEADTRLLLHAKYISSTDDDSRIIIQSPDTDVLVLCAAHFDHLNCEELWFKTGVKDRLRYIPVHDICRTLDESLCRALPAFHALTGCDTNSALAGVSKKKAWEVLSRNEMHQASLGLLGCVTLDQITAKNCEQFICDLYPSRKKASTADELRYLLFCQKKQKSEMLPPTSDSLLQHLKRANYQTYIWRTSLTAMQDLPSPEGNGWKKEDTILQPVLMTKEPAPRSLMELTTCQCKKARCQSNCSCKNTGLSCTEACFCMADPDVCKNPHGVLLDYNSGQSDDSDSD